MVKHPSGNFEISFAHCSAFMPVIVVSMLEITVFTPLSKGRAEGTVIFPDKCLFCTSNRFFSGAWRISSYIFSFFCFQNVFNLQTCILHIKTMSKALYYIRFTDNDITLVCTLYPYIFGQIIRYIT